MYLYLQLYVNMRSRVWAEGRSLTTASVFLGSRPTAPTTSSEHLQSKENVYEIFWRFFWYIIFFWISLKILFQMFFWQPPHSPHYVLQTSASKRKCLWGVFENTFLFKCHVLFESFFKFCLKCLFGHPPDSPHYALSSEWETIFF